MGGSTYTVWLRAQYPKAQIQALPLTGCVTLGKSLTFSKLQSSV